MQDSNIEIVDKKLEKNLSLVDQVLEAFNKHDLEQFMDFYDESALYYRPTQIEPLKGREAIREGFEQMMFTSFPDMKIEKIRAFGQDDWLCIQAILLGTHTGPLPGPTGEEIPPTNKSIRVPMCLVIKVKDGKFTEAHEYIDQLGFLAQLGLQ
ncbi:hypothetical protein LCGC14_2887810 [marine sediment metagenome]|uniref:SnoaL-like domain-containing protein n=1 Tax=marine sediment metagenome TaxID=412755 RepID=A0A0F8XYF6_9ZZZZ|nr:hypothetical protein [archaeon]